MAAETYQGPYICFRKPDLKVFQPAVHRSLTPEKLTMKQEYIHKNSTI